MNFCMRWHITHTHTLLDESFKVNWTESLQSDCGKANRIYSLNMNAYVFECHPLVEMTYSYDDVAKTTCMKKG